LTTIGAVGGADAWMGGLVEAIRDELVGFAGSCGNERLNRTGRGTCMKSTKAIEKEG